MKVIDLHASFAAQPVPGAPLFLASFVAGPSRVGVLTRSAGSRDGAWERHDGGDELLVIVRGRARFKFELPDGATEIVEVGPAQALLIPRGAAHTATILEDVHVLFVNPCEGNHEWDDAATR
jgi:mannose-6-phosphate isomerase-like protein (cupin superfamily)